MTKPRFYPSIARCFAVFAIFALVLPVFMSAALNERIAISSTAARDYNRAVAGPNGLRPETYIFTPGQYFPGGTRDHGLETTSFDSLAKILATDLAKQNYYPTKDVAGADLVIMVHWGATSVYEDPQKDTMIDRLNDAMTTFNAQVADGGIADTGPMNDISEAMASAQDNSSRAMRRNAILMGYARTLDKNANNIGITSTDEVTMRTELSEERYVVVLMAYDNQVLRKDKIRKLRWVTRLSVRTAGNNFGEALPALCKAGSSVFGQDVQGLVHAKANLREGKVELGDLKIVGTEEAAAPPEKSH